MEPEPRIFPRSSAFEALLAKVYLELWELQENDRPKFARRVRQFVKVWMTIFRSKLPDKLPNYDEKLKKMDEKIKELEQIKQDADPLTEESIDRESIPEVEAELAEEVWAAVVDILTDAGFNFPMAAAKPRRYMRA